MSAVTSERVRPGAGRPALNESTAWLFAPVDVASIAVFRVGFGIILLIECYRWLSPQNGWMHEFTAPFHFTYHGFEWLPVLPSVVIVALVFALGLLALMIALGWHYRLTVTLFWLGFTYMFLLDKALYLNHFYLVCLLSFAMIFIPAARRLSLDARWRPQLAGDYVPAWSLWLLRAQIAIPYFYGGIAKIGSDWLNGQPMQMRMDQMTHIQAYVPWFGEHWLAMVFSYGGLLLDLFVVPLMLWPRTRMITFVVTVGFHLCNAWMFRIGIFPWFMIVATTLYFPPDWPRKRFRWPAAKPATAIVGEMPWGGRFSIGLLVVFLAIQVLQPWRHWAWGTQVDWTEDGSKFAWRMMLNEKLTALHMTAVDSRTRESIPLDVPGLLTPRQIDKMSGDPEMLREFAYFAGQALEAERGAPVEIYALVYCALNGRKPQLFIDPEVNLAAIERSMGKSTFVLPLTEPLPAKAYVIPPQEWKRAFDLKWPAPSTAPNRSGVPESEIQER